MYRWSRRSETSGTFTPPAITSAGWRRADGSPGASCARAGRCCRLASGPSAAFAVGVALGVGQAGERLQVGHALAPLYPPRPLPADRGGETERERRGAGLVRVA